MKKFISITLSLSLFLSGLLHPGRALAQGGPVPGNVVNPVLAPFPAQMKGLLIDPANPLTIDFLIDQGDPDKDEGEFKDEANRLIKYFLAALTIPEEDMWVNLSPDEPDRIIPDIFGETLMGRDLLLQDYFLKQLTASLSAPDTEIGERFWKEMSTNDDQDTSSDMLGKIWIVPAKAVIYEHARGAVVVEKQLKIELEESAKAFEALFQTLSMKSTTAQPLPILDKFMMLSS